MIKKVFRTEDVPAPHRFDAWREEIKRTHAPAEMMSSHTTNIFAQQHVLELGAVSVWSMDTQPVTLRRTPRLIRESAPEFYHLSFIRSGRVRFIADGRYSEYGPYGLRTSEYSRPFEVRLLGSNEVISAMGLEVPKALLPLPRAAADLVVGRPLFGGVGVGRLLTGYLTQVSSNVDAYTPADGPRLGMIMADLLGALFAHELDADDALAPEARHRTLTLRIRAFIQRHLHDPHLTPRTVAAAHHISLSHLHRLFQPDGTTVSGWIRNQRLERARRDLADPAQRSVPVHHISARWGFTHHAVFSRAFRAAYGMPPRDYRQSASAAADASSRSAGRGAKGMPPSR